MQLILTQQQIEQKIMRLSHELLENTYGENELYIGGIIGKGELVAHKIATIIKQNSKTTIHIFTITLHKDLPLEHPIDCSIDPVVLKGKTVILVDDVINSGTTMQYGLIKILEQPVKSVKTVALVDRLHRRYPIKCDFVGLTLTTTLKERVEVVEKDGKMEAYLV